MTKPLQDNIRDVRIEDENGDLLPALDVAGAKLEELIGAIVATNKAGSLTMKIDLKPSTAGALAVKASVSIKKPKGLPIEALLWPTPENNLMADDPRQVRLDLKTLTVEPARNLKTVGA